MKSSNVILLVLAAFGAGMLADRQLPRRDSLPFGGEDERQAPMMVSVLEASQSGDASAKGSDGGERQSGDQDRRYVKPVLTQLLALGDQDHMHRALHGASAAELQQLLAETASMKASDPHLRALKRALFVEWAHKQPEKALAAAIQESDQHLQASVIHTVFEELARDDWEGAKRALQQLHTRRQLEEAIGAIAHATPLATMPDVAGLISSAHHEQFYGAWAERDPLAAAGHAESAGQSTRVLRSIAERWVRQDPLTAVNWAKQFGTNVMTGALHALAEQDPAQAAAWLATLPPGNEANDLARQVAHRWAQDDIDSALAWSDTLTGRMRNGAFEELSHQWAQTDPQAAADFALSLEQGEARKHALSEVAQTWARENIDQALEWAQALEAQESVSALRGIVETMADESPQAAAELVAQYSGQEAFHDLAGDLAGHWSEFQPAAAAAWAEALPQDSEIKHRAVESVAGHWVESDPRAASQWIGSLPTGKIRDIAAERLVDHIAESDPNAAFEWAMTVSDLDHQTGMLHHVLEQWNDIDPSAAQASLNNAALSADQRQNLSEIFIDRP